MPWSPRQTPWDFGSQLLKPDLDRITPELQVAFQHYPAMGTIGIKKVVNGPFTFSPDGNPLVGPVRGLRGYWVACGVMAGLSQGGGVGLALATWMAAGDDGDPGMDIWAMDVARYGDYATLGYTNAKVQENYRRRFRITFPNEELPAARPLLTTPIHDRLTAANAVWGATFGLEHALWFQAPGLAPRRGGHLPTLERLGPGGWRGRGRARARRHDRDLQLREVPGHRPGRRDLAVIAAHRAHAGRRAHHADGDAQRPGPHRRRVHGRATIGRRRVLPLRLPARRGPSLALVPAPPADRRQRPLRGPRPGPDRAVRGRPAFARRPVGRGARSRPLDRGLPVHVVPAGRSGDDPGPPRPDQLRGRSRLRAVGRAGVPARALRPDHGRRRVARHPAVRDARAHVAAAREELRDVVPRVPSDLHAARGRASRRYIRLDHDFIGRAAHEAELAAGGPKRRLCAFVVEPDPDDPADVIGDEPIWHDGAVVGWVTSGGYGHHVKQSIALGYVPTSSRRPTVRAARASRSRSSAGGVQPGSSPSRSSTRRACGCASDDRVRQGASCSTGSRSRSRSATRWRSPILRAGEVPGRGGTLCLAGDCGNCLATVDGVAYVRTCQVAGAARVSRSCAIRLRRLPPLPVVDGTDATRPPLGQRIAVRAPRGGCRRHRRRRRPDSTPSRKQRRRTGTSCCSTRARAGRSWPSTRVPRSWHARPNGMLHVDASEIVVATGAAEIQPVCPGSRSGGHRHRSRRRAPARGRRGPRARRSPSGRHR